MAWPKAMPVVEVEWIDSNHEGRWQDTDALDKSLAALDLGCKTTGYLYREAPDWVTVLQSQAAVGCVSEATTIPRVAIVSMTVLKEA
jgi:hypothetical protein